MRFRPRPSLSESSSRSAADFPDFLFETSKSPSCVWDELFEVSNSLSRTSGELSDVSESLSEVSGELFEVSKSLSEVSGELSDVSEAAACPHLAALLVHKSLSWASDRFLWVHKGKIVHNVGCFVQHEVAQCAFFILLRTRTIYFIQKLLPYQRNCLSLHRDNYAITKTITYIYIIYGIKDCRTCQAGT